MYESIVNILIAFATISVAVATFLLWRSTNKVVEATNATKNMAKEVGSYSIIPRFELIHHEREQQDGYYQYAVKLINNGKDTAYNVIVETKSNDVSSTQHIPFNLPVRYQIWIAHSVKLNEKIIHFNIKFEDVAGNKHVRELNYEITDDKLWGKTISWQLNKPFPDNVKI